MLTTLWNNKIANSMIKTDYILKTVHINYSIRSHYQNIINKYNKIKLGMQVNYSTIINGFPEAERVKQYIGNPYNLGNLESIFEGSTYSYNLNLNNKATIALSKGIANIADGQFYFNYIQEKNNVRNDFFISCLIVRNEMINYPHKIKVVICRNINYLILGFGRIGFNEKEIYIKELNRIINIDKPYKNWLALGFEFFYKDRLNKAGNYQWKILLMVPFIDNYSFSEIVELLSKNHTGALQNQQDMYYLNYVINKQTPYRPYNDFIGEEDTYLVLANLGIVFDYRIGYNFGERLKLTFNFNLTIKNEEQDNFKFYFGPEVYLI